MYRTSALLWILILSLAAIPQARGQGAPEIEVQFLSNAQLRHLTPWNWGGLTVGIEVTVGLRISNTGTVPLTGLAATVENYQSAVFTAKSQPAATVQPGGSTIFNVSCRMDVTGEPRTGSLRITNNDADEGPYEVTLYATGRVPDIHVTTVNGQEIVNGGTYDFGMVHLGAGSSRELYIGNKDYGVLYLGPAELSGDLNDFRFPVLNGQSAIYGAQAGGVMVFAPLSPGPKNLTVTFTSNDPDESPYEIHLTGVGGIREMVVEQPVGSAPLIEHEIRDFGEVGVGSEKTLIYVIRNPGNSPVMLEPRIISGFSFQLVMLPQNPLPAGEIATMVVRFAPTSAGADQGYLTIRHDVNTGLSSPFALRFTGEGQRSTISFTSTITNAGHEDSEARVTVTRTNPGIPATVQVQTLPLEAVTVPPISKAEPDVDYTPLSGEAVMVNFAVGETEKTVVVPLLAPAAKAGMNRHLKLVLSTPGTSATLGTVKEATVRIRAVDTAKPTLTLTSPVVTAGQAHATSPTLVAGMAGDAKGIERVEVKLNDAAPVLATLDVNAKSPTAVPFTAQVTPVEGGTVNVLVVTAYDLRGNSTTTTRSFSFIRRRLLTLMSRSDLADDPIAGTLAMTATPASGATALLAGVWHVPGDFWDPDGDDYQIKTTMVAPGTKIRVVTTPKAGKVFGGWWMWAPVLFDEEIPAQHLGNEVTFTMPDTDVMVDGGVTSVTFAPKEGETNSTHWLAESFSATEPSAYLRGTVTPSGSFSGKLLIAGEAVPVVATWYAQAPAVFTVAGKKRTSLTIKNWEVMLVPRTPGDLPSLEIGLPGERAVGLSYARRGSYSARNKVPRSLLNVGGVRGQYTACLQVPMSGIRAPAAGIAYAKGTGYLTMNLTNTGALTLAGMMADGETMTMNSELLNTSAPVFVQMPTPGGTTKGALLCGMMDFKGTETEPYVNDYLQWYRPAAASTKVLLYPKGWPDGISVELHGEPYSSAVTFQAGLGASAPEPGQEWGNGLLYFSDGGLTGSVIKDNFNLVRNSVVKMAPVDSSYTLTLSPATGLFSGTFTPVVSPPKAPAGPKLNFKGMILQSYSKLGLGFFINNAKGVTNQESGGVSLY